MTNTMHSHEFGFGKKIRKEQLEQVNKYREEKISGKQKRKHSLAVHLPKNSVLISISLASYCQWKKDQITSSNIFFI